MAITRRQFSAEVKREAVHGDADAAPAALGKLNAFARRALPN